MITLGLSRIDFSRLRQPKISLRKIAFEAAGPVPFVETLLMMRMQLVVEIPSNVRCAAPITPATARRLRVAIEGILQAEDLPLERAVFASDHRQIQG